MSDGWMMAIGFCIYLLGSLIWAIIAGLLNPKTFETDGAWAYGFIWPIIVPLILIALPLYGLSLLAEFIVGKLRKIVHEDEGV